MTVSEYLEAGFEVAKLPAGGEPDVNTKNYYGKMTLLGTVLPSPPDNIAVRKHGVFAVMIKSRFTGSADTMEGTTEFQVLKAANSLFIHSPALAIAAFSFRDCDYLQEGTIRSGPLIGCAVIAPPRGFLVSGTHSAFGQTFSLTSEGTLKRPTPELAEILTKTGMYRAGL